MSARQCLWKSLGVWLGLGIFCSAAFAQPSFPAAQGPRFPSRAIPQGNERFHFGVMGQVARPGVYELSEPEPQLVDLIHHAGGLTRQATRQIFIVRQGDAGQRVFYSPSLYFPLLSGDLVVADGTAASEPLEITPRSPSAIQNADFEEAPPVETFRHVALMNVLDRPVILPVPEQHANLPALVAYLGQSPAIRSQIKIQPVGPGREFEVPTVLYFPPRSVQRERLPKLPDAYRVTSGFEHPEVPDTAERPEIPSLPAVPISTPSIETNPVGAYAAVERFQRPEANSMAAPQGLPSIQFPNPPSMARTREQEQQRSKQTQKAAPTTVSDSDKENLLDAEEEETAWWPYVGMVLVVVISGGTWYVRWRQRQIPQTPPGSFVPESREIPVPSWQEPEIIPEDRTSQQTASALAQMVRKDKILASLVFNQLPVQENPSEPVSSEPPPEKPQARKVFRLDPPEPEAAVVAKAPHITTKPATILPPADEPSSPQPKTVAEKSAPPAQPSVPSTRDIKQGPGLLDRVLQQVHQKRAA